jgi:hypothetical protein
MKQQCTMTGRLHRHTHQKTHIGTAITVVTGSHCYDAGRANTCDATHTTHKDCVPQLFYLYTVTNTRAKPLQKTAAAQINTQLERCGSSGQHLPSLQKQMVQHSSVANDPGIQQIEGSTQSYISRQLMSSLFTTHACTTTSSHSPPSCTDAQHIQAVQACNTAEDRHNSPVGSCTQAACANARRLVTQERVLSWLVCQLSSAACTCRCCSTRCATFALAAAVRLFVLCQGPAY